MLGHVHSHCSNMQQTCLVQQLKALNGIGDLLVANNDLGDEAEVSVSEV